MPKNAKEINSFGIVNVLPSSSSVLLLQKLRALFRRPATRELRHVVWLRPFLRRATSASVCVSLNNESYPQHLCTLNSSSPNALHLYGTSFNRQLYPAKEYFFTSARKVRLFAPFSRVCARRSPPNSPHTNAQKSSPPNARLHGVITASRRTCVGVICARVRMRALASHVAPKTSLAS